MVEVKSVTKCYGSLKAVQDVSFAVEKGEIVGFVGPNGAGKSTVLKMLSTFIYPTTGTVRIGGMDVVEYPLAARRAIGYLSGDTPLYPNMRVDRFLRFIGCARGLEKERLKDRFEEMVEVFDLGPVLLKRVRQCSTGYRQRIGLAAALVHDPPVLLLDEPTHGFDPLQVLAFRDLLKSLKPGRAILFSTHIIQEVAALCDRVLILYGGRLLADGRPRELAEAVGLPEDRLEDIFAGIIRQSREACGV